MKSIQELKHVLYRLKAKIFYHSVAALTLRDWIWKSPGNGVVKITFKEEQNILHYFDWKEIQDSTASIKLKTFTERYANEPNVIYEIEQESIIEPGYGLVITKGRRFVSQSSTLGHTYLRPGLLKYLQHTIFNRKYTHFNHVIHCDGFAGNNLCHFFYDTLNPILFMYERNLILPGTPVLIGESVYNRAFFQYFLSHSFFSKINWVIQKKNEWIKVKKFTKPFVSMEVFKSTYKITKPVAQPPFRRIFLNRKSVFQRNIKNIDQLIKILKNYDFQFVYAEDLSYEEQVSLFRETKIFVGIHGAGLSNLLHSNIPSLRVLEIFSESLVHASFYRFLKILDVEFYDAIAGSKFDINWNFEVDEKAFHDAVKRLIENETISTV